MDHGARILSGAGQVDFLVSGAQKISSLGVISRALRGSDPPIEVIHDLDDGSRQ